MWLAATARRKRQRVIQIVAAHPTDELSTSIKRDARQHINALSRRSTAEYKLSRSLQMIAHDIHRLWPTRSRSTGINRIVWKEYGCPKAVGAGVVEKRQTKIIARRRRRNVSCEQRYSCQFFS